MKIIKANPNYVEPIPLWGHVLYPEALNLLTAPPKAGKSMVLMSLFQQLAKGLSWGRIEPVRPVKTLYVDFENPEWLIEKRLGSFDSPNFIVARRDWVEWISNFSFDEVEKTVKDLGFTPDNIVLDPLSLAFPVKENDAQSMLNALRRCKLFIAKTGISVTLAHHDRKPSKEEIADDPRYSARGSSALAGAVDIQMNILFTVRQRKLQVTMSRYGSGADYEPSWLLTHDNKRGLGVQHGQNTQEFYLSSADTLYRNHDVPYRNHDGNR